MQILGPERLDAHQIGVERGRVRTLLRAAPPGNVVVATRDDGALARAALGALDAGRALVPLDPQAPAREVEALLPGAGLLLLDPEPATRWPLPAGVELRTVVPGVRRSAWQRLLGRSAEPVQSFPGCLEGLEPSPPEPAVPDQPALLLSTSGTTSAPRLVPWTREAVLAQQGTLARALELDEHSRLLNLLPMHHIDGLVMGLLVADHAGCALVRTRTPVLQHLTEVLDSLWRERVTHLVLTPALLSMLLRAGEDLRELFDARRFRFFISTAAPLPDALWRQVEAATGRPVVNVYGLTETGNLLFAGPEAATRRVGTVGRPRDCEIRVVSPDGVPLPAGEPGELQIRGPSVTRAPPDPGRALREGYYPTGDLATIEADGLVRVHGRLKSMLSVGGLKVEPGEVERTLLEHPAVRDVHVRGEPDPVWGERVTADVVAEGVTEAELTAFLRQRLSEHKVPRRWRLVDRVRRGETGKPPARPEDPLEERVLDVAARVFGADRARLSLAARIGELPGWDSLGHLDLVDALERTFEVRIVGRELLRLRSLADAVALLERAHG